MSAPVCFIIVSCYPTYADIARLARAISYAARRKQEWRRQYTHKVVRERSKK